MSISTDFDVRFFSKEVSAKARAKAQKTIWAGPLGPLGPGPPKLFLGFGSGFGIDFFENNGNGNGNGKFDRYIFFGFTKMYGPLSNGTV